MKCAAGVDKRATITRHTVSDIPDAELLRRAVEGARCRKERGWHPRYVAVMETFVLGSTFSWQLCARFGLDGDEKVKR